MIPYSHFQVWIFVLVFWSKLISETCQAKLWTKIRQNVVNIAEKQLKMDIVLFSEDPMGGWKKEGGGKPHEWHPSQKGVLDPPRTVRFPPPLTCQCSDFPAQKSTTEQTRSSFGGVQKFSGERVLWYVFPPPYVLHPPISPPNCSSFCLVCWGWGSETIPHYSWTTSAFGSNLFFSRPSELQPMTTRNSLKDAEFRCWALQLSCLTNISDHVRESCPYS